MCLRFHVLRLDVFASAARGEFEPGRSDVDFLVEFAFRAQERAFDTYFGLKEGLEGLFGRQYVEYKTRVRRWL